MMKKKEKKDDNCDKDILDLTHSKIGFINFSLKLFIIILNSLLLNIRKNIIF